MLVAWLRRMFAWSAPVLSQGQRGEAAAAKFLQRLGYRIVGRGERSRLGELDLVAIDGRTVVFVEVKTRDSAAHGRPEEAVDQEKQRRVTRAALGYLKRHGLLDQPARFDVVSVLWPPEVQQPTIEHFRDAFPAAGLRGMFS